MNNMEKFEQLAERARMESVPETNVAGAVMSRLGRSTRPALIPSSPMVWLFSAGSAAAAVILGTLGWMAWVELSTSAFTWLEEFTSWGGI